MGIYLHTQGIYRQGSAYRGISTRDRRHRVQGCGIGSSNRAEVNTDRALLKETRRQNKTDRTQTDDKTER